MIERPNAAILAAQILDALEHLDEPGANALDAVETLLRRALWQAETSAIERALPALAMAMRHLIEPEPK